MPIRKEKGGIHDTGRYRGIIILSQAMKLLERIIDARVRNVVQSKTKSWELGYRYEHIMDCV